MVLKSTLLVIVVSAIALTFAKWDPISRYSLFSKNECLITFSPLIQELFQPVVDCDFCRPIKAIRREANLSPENFEKWYGYGSQQKKYHHLQKYNVCMSTSSSQFISLIQQVCL